MRVAAVFVAGVLLALGGVYLGAWWAPFIVGLAIGVAEPRSRFALPIGAIAGLASWGAMLGAAHLRYGLGLAASSLAAIMGFGNQRLIPVVLTLVVGLLLGLTGAWLGSAGRNLMAERQPAISR
ncbi:MAG TPA: hypothetical protein VGG90_11245 [Candidatus Dormibacteraeota bacterium]|jgi:hypothetical protein